MRILVPEKINKFLQKQLKKDCDNIRKVDFFLKELENIENPQALKNAAKVQGIAGNYWR